MTQQPSMAILDENELKMTNTLSAKQRKAIPLILQGRTIREGCEKAGISKETYYQWCRDPLFRSSLEDKLQEIVVSGIHELKMSFNQTVTVLSSLLESDNELVKLRAASQILDFINRFIQYEQMDKRLTELERRILK